MYVYIINKELENGNNMTALLLRSCDLLQETAASQGDSRCDKLPVVALCCLFLYVKICKKSYSFSQNYEAESEKRCQRVFNLDLSVCLADLKSAQV